MFENTLVFCSFSAPDMEKMQEFYGGVLGLKVERSLEGLNIELYGGGRVFIYLSTDYHAPEHTILNFLVEDIETVVDELAKRGVVMEQYPEFHTDEKGICRNDGKYPGPYAIAWFKDPAEHIISVIQEKP